MTCWLHTTDGKRFLVDDEDFETLSDYRWACGDKPYASRHFGYRHHEGKRIAVKTSLHREILGLLPGNPLIADHIDRNPFNCTRANLRPVDHRGSSWNTGPRRRGKFTSKYKGVTVDVPDRVFRATITPYWGAKQIIGWFNDETQAALYYDYYARIYGPSTAYLNFPDVVLDEPPTGLTREEFGPRRGKQFKGVYRHHDYYHAVFKGKSLGYHATPEAAARTYDAAVVESGIENAYLNFPNEAGQTAPPRLGKQAFGPNRGKRFKGVVYQKSRGRYRASIRHNGKDVYISTHEREEDAARAYDAKALELYGPGCYLNFPPNAPAVLVP